jgi:hypothetical protein
MNFNLIKVDGTVHTVNHMAGVGFYVDIDGQATTKLTKDELLEELSSRHSEVHPIPSTSTDETTG